jgi:hypothetical protein
MALSETNQIAGNRAMGNLSVSTEKVDRPFNLHALAINRRDIALS